MKLVLIKAKKIRREELENRAEAYAAAGNQVMEVVLKELINREKSKNTWRKIKRVLDKSEYFNLTKLTVLIVGEDEDQILTKKEEIHEAIINYNIKHYSKPEHSPFGLGTFLCEAIGPHGTTEFSDRILVGELDSEKGSVRRSL